MRSAHMLYMIIGTFRGGDAVPIYRRFRDATEPGVHILAKGSGSSVTLKTKDGRERIFAP